MPSKSAPSEGNPSEELLALCQRSNWEPDPTEVQQLVLKKANIFTINPLTRNSILVDLSFNNQLRAVQYCLLDSHPPLSLNMKEGDWSRTYLHNFCDYKVAQENSKAILNIIIDRFEKGTEESRDAPLDWTIKDKWGLTPLDMIAYRGRLASLWPILRSISYFVEDRKKRSSSRTSKGKEGKAPLIQRHIIFYTDFALLSEDQQKELVC